MSNRRRRRRSEKKPVNRVSLLTMSFGIFFCILFLWILLRALNGIGNGRPEIAAGLLSILLSIVCLIRGLIEYRKDNYNKSSRLLGFLLPLISLGLWLSVYILGLVRG